MSTSIIMVGSGEPRPSRLTKERHWPRAEMQQAKVSVSGSSEITPGSLQWAEVP